MKKAGLIFNGFWQRFLLILMTFLYTGMIHGQDRGVDIEIEKDSGGAGWLGSWYFWIGLAVFIIILVALVSSSRKRV